MALQEGSCDETPQAASNNDALVPIYDRFFPFLDLVVTSGSAVTLFDGGFSSNADEKLPVLTVLGNIALLLSLQRSFFLGGNTPKQER
jgi:hypothetical protein